MKVKGFEYIQLEIILGDLESLNSLASAGWHIVTFICRDEFGGFALLERPLPDDNGLIQTAINTMRTVAQNMAQSALINDLNWAQCNIHDLRSTADELEKQIKGNQ